MGDIRMLAAAGGELSKSSRLEDLYAAHAGEAFRLAYLLTGSRDLADDLAQEAFVRAVSRFHHLRDRDSFGLYLRRTVVNLANSHWRHQSVERRYLTRQLEGRPAQAEMPDVETRDTVWHLLEQLPARQRAALVLRYYEDLTEHQAAVVLGVSVRALNSLVARGLDRLRRSEGGPPWTD